MVDKTPARPLFDLESVFDVDDYLFVYHDELNDERTEGEVATIVKWLELDTPLKILDLACGFGRHTNRLAALGHSVTGIDYIPGFLELARREAERIGVRVDYRQGDMRQVDFQDEFDRVLLFFTSFGYFEDGENKQVIQNMSRALKPGGLMLFDTLNRDTLLKNLYPSDVVEKDGGLLINRFSFDPITGQLQNRRIVIRDGIRKDKPYAVRMYNATEICTLLEQAGLTEYQILGQDNQPLSASSRRMVVIARKS